MDFDWHNPPFEFVDEINVREVEESFEDPFSVRLLPDSPRFEETVRYFNLGRSSKGNGIFSVYRTNGKQLRVVCARPFVSEELFFYKRRMKQLLD